MFQKIKNIYCLLYIKFIKEKIKKEREYRLNLIKSHTQYMKSTRDKYNLNMIKSETKEELLKSKIIKINKEMYDEKNY